MVTWVPEVRPDARNALIEAARKSVSLHPERPAEWVALGNLLIRTGRFEEAADALNDGAARLPAEPKLHLLLASARQRLGELTAAMAAVEKALSLAPCDRGALLRRFDLLVHTRQWDRVAQELDAMTAIMPTRNSVIWGHVHFVRNGGNPEALLAVCDAALAQDAGHTGALYHKAVALAMLGRDAEARTIIELDRFVGIDKLAVHRQSIRGTALLDVVAAEIRRNPTLVPDPHGKATRGGLQARGVLTQDGDEAVPRLVEQIKSAVERYIDALPALPHPFTTARPERVRLDAWAVIYSQDGRQTSHFHPSGWISGVTYVTAPRGAEESHYRGPLVVGEPDAGLYSGPPPWGTREIEPIPGQIVLFPSFVPHATRPTGLAEERICVAFDVVPGRDR
jgi:uncharacterized protein (TIGR02466 family)